MSTTDINSYLDGFELSFKKVEMASSKRNYVKDILSSASDNLVIQIANELDIKHDFNTYNDFEIENFDDLSFKYIDEQIKKCEYKVTNDDYDGAITNARTLLETVCICILEDVEWENIPYNGDVIDLHKEISKLLKMKPDIYNEDFLKQISSGFFSIVNGIANLRNKLSDSHGKSKEKYYKPSYRHADLAVKSVFTISEYLYRSWKNSK